MYRRGAFHILVLLLVVLVGSAVAQQLTGTQLLVTGTGPHAIGGAAKATTQLTLLGSFSTSDGSARAVDIAGTYTSTTADAYGIELYATFIPSAGRDAYGVYIVPTVNKAGSGTHGNFISLRVDPPTIGAGAATLTNASTLKITDAPSGATNNYALWVARGAALLGGTLRVTGDAQFDGNIAAKYQDVAEWVPSVYPLAAGTVAIIDSRSPNRVIASDKPYDTRVAGVVSTQPGILLGEPGADKTKLAHSGRVKVKVDARYGAIAIGDLLVSSATPGRAMRSEPINIGGGEMHRPGTIVGKALEPLEAGQGEILVLLALQ